MRAARAATLSGEGTLSVSFSSVMSAIPAVVATYNGSPFPDPLGITSITTAGFVIEGTAGAPFNWIAVIPQ
jgi:hypothetical protein